MLIVYNNMFIIFYLFLFVGDNLIYIYIYMSLHLQPENALKPTLVGRKEGLGVKL